MKMNVLPKHVVNKDFSILLLADFLSTAGLWFGIFANLQLLSLMVASDFYKSIVLICGPVFLILASPYAGTVIDRTPIKKIIIRSGYVQFISSLMLLFAYLTSSLMWLVLALILQNLANAFYTPSLKSAIPSIVPKQQLLQANAMYMNITTFARISITGLSGLALSFLPLWAMYAAVISCYLVMNVLRYFLHIGETSTSSKQERMPFKEVFRLLHKEPVLLVLLINIALIYLFLGGSSLIILKFSELHASHALQGFLYGVEGISLLFAGFVVKRIYANRNSLLINTILVAGTGCSMLLMQTGTIWVWGAYCGYALFGFLVGCWSPSYSTISQATVPEEIRGRFFAFQEMWNRIMQQLALLYTGFMFDLVGLANHLLITAIVISLGASIVLTVINKANLRATVLQK